MSNKTVFITEQLRANGTIREASVSPGFREERFLPGICPGSISKMLSGCGDASPPPRRAQPVILLEDQAAGRLKPSRTKYSTQVAALIRAIGSQPSYDRNVADLDGSKELGLRG